MSSEDSFEHMIKRMKITDKMATNDLEKALPEFVSEKPISIPVTNPIGCNVKWDEMDAHWMPEAACDLV